MLDKFLGYNMMFYVCILYNDIISMSHYKHLFFSVLRTFRNLYSSYFEICIIINSNHSPKECQNLILSNFNFVVANQPLPIPPIFKNFK